MDDKHKVGRQDRERINIHEPYELRDWAKHFGVTTDQIKLLVEKYGVMVKDVEPHVRGHKH